MKTDVKKSRLIKFSLRRTKAVAKRVLIQIFRDRRTFGMLILMPILIMLIFGYALSGELTNVQVVLQNHDNGLSNPFIGSINFGDDIESYLDTDDRLSLSDASLTYEEAKQAVEDGEYSAVIVIPDNFTLSIVQKKTDPNTSVVISIYIDATKPQIRGTILSALRDAMQEGIGLSFVDIDQEYAFGGAEYSGLDTSIPSVMGYILTFLIILVAMITLIRDKLLGTQERLYVTPLTSLERLIGFTVALVVLGIIQTGVTLGIGIFVFGATVRGDLFVLITAGILYALSQILMSVFLSNFAENELQAAQIAPMIGLPSLALSGILVPISALPSFIQPLSYALPLTYGTIIFEGIMLKGYGFAELMREFLIIGGFCVLFLLLALITVRDIRD